jgi:hypothetical protein
MSTGAERNSRGQAVAARTAGRENARMKRRGALFVLGSLLGAAPGLLPAEPPEPTSSLLEEPALFAAAVRARFGAQARILSLTVRHDAAEIQVQDPANLSHVDRYEFEDGSLQAPEPVQVGRNQKQLEARLFALADVELALVPRLLADAHAQARTEDARVANVSIERHEGFGEYSYSWGQPRIRVVVDGPRGGAVVEYALDGKRKGVTRW